MSRATGSGIDVAESEESIIAPNIDEFEDNEGADNQVSQIS